MSAVARRVAVVIAIVGTLLLAAAVAYFALTAVPRDPVAEVTESTMPAPPAVIAPPTRVILTPTEDPTTSQSFSWLAGDVSHADGKVQIRSTGGDVRTVDAYAAGAVNGNPLEHFSTTVTGLEPATSYEYRVGLEGSWSRWREFSTADPNDTDFEFIYYGDAQIGLDSTWPSVVGQAEATAPDVDRLGARGRPHQRPLDETGVDQLVRGHGRVRRDEERHGGARQPRVHRRPAPSRVEGELRVPAQQPDARHERPTRRARGGRLRHRAAVRRLLRPLGGLRGRDRVLHRLSERALHHRERDARRGLPDPGESARCARRRCPSHKVGELWTQFQAAWLDHVLTDSPSKWNVVTFHQPVFSASVGRDEPVLRAYWVPVFQEHNVDLVLMGHDHVYARGYNNDDETSEPGMTDGPVYVVSNSGAKHYELTPETTTSGR